MAYVGYMDISTIRLFAKPALFYERVCHGLTKAAAKMWFAFTPVEALAREQASTLAKLDKVDTQIFKELLTGSRD